MALVHGSSSSDIILRAREKYKYDVFLSFRGPDTRDSFTSHLYEALCRDKIRAYKDDKELESGDDISPALLKAISESKLSVIIFSNNYATSPWCLDELVHILECRGQHFVMPIFYEVDPSHIRRQLGSYADAFVKHEERYKAKVLMWRNALTTAGNISGYDSQQIRPESELLKRVVNDILVKLNRKSQSASRLEGLIGIEQHIRQVELLLSLEDSRDVQVVGIWGMGGVGKTTIAEVVFDHISSQFEACCFVKDVREASETKHGANDLWNQILRKLLNEENLGKATPSIRSSFVEERLTRTKALIILDDVSGSTQEEGLVEDCFRRVGPGSRIIITSRNKRMIRNGLVDGKIYEVEVLDVHEALELFSLRAFRSTISPPGDYITFAKEVVDYAGGNPLALRILGSVFFHCKSKEDWAGELDKLRKYPHKNIHKALRLSFDGLDDNERGIFLDIACYHKGKNINEAKRILDASGFSANAGVRLLIDMSLISIDKYSKLMMHDLIQEMGQTIVRDECVKDLGQRSRVWIAKDVCYVLKNNKGTEAIECLAMTMDPTISDLHMQPAVFKEMSHLRLIQFIRYLDPDLKWVNKVHLPHGLNYLPQALRIVRWDSYPLNSIPSEFYPDNLVELHMPHSGLKQLWDKDQKINLGSLTKIDLRFSEHLVDVSSLINSPNLRSIDLGGCTSLVQLPSSFQHLAKLTRLELYWCSNLKVLPEMPSNLETLELRGTAIEELPSSICCLKKLDNLNIRSCKELKNIPSSICKLNSLRSLDLADCLSLGSLPNQLPSGLMELYLSGCESLRSLPVELPSRLRTLNFSDCESLEYLPVQLPSGLVELSLRNCVSLVSLPAKLPSRLTKLDLWNCKSLVSLPFELPSLLRYLELSDCTSLQYIPRKLPSGLKDMNLNGCCSGNYFPSLFQNLVSENGRSSAFLPHFPQLLRRVDANGLTSLEYHFSRRKSFPTASNLLTAKIISSF